PAEARPVVQAMAKDEGRVVIRCRPYSTFAQPPRHLYRNDQPEWITHWITNAMPWNAADEVYRAPLTAPHTQPTPRTRPSQPPTPTPRQNGVLIDDAVIGYLADRRLEAREEVVHG